MAKLNKKLIQQRAYELGGVISARGFERFMGWNSPSKASRIFNGTATKPELDTLEEVAFKLSLDPNHLIIPSSKRVWPDTAK